MKLVFAPNSIFHHKVLNDPNLPTTEEDLAPQVGHAPLNEAELARWYGFLASRDDLTVILGLTEKGDQQYQAA